MIAFDIATKMPFSFHACNLKSSSFQFCIEEKHYFIQSKSKVRNVYTIHVIILHSAGVFAIIWY